MPGPGARLRDTHKVGQLLFRHRRFLEADGHNLNSVSVRHRISSGLTRIVMWIEHVEACAVSFLYFISEMLQNVTRFRPGVELGYNDDLFYPI